MKNIITELTETKANLLAVFSEIDPVDFNAVPFEGSWTPGQLGEHLAKATGVGVLYGETVPPERPMDEKIPAISGVFLNFDVKYQPPAELVPSNDFHDKNDLLSQLDQIYSSAIEAAKSLDLSAICTSFVVPGFGPFTRLEFLWLFNVHTIRHTRQLKNIAAAFR